MWDLIVLVPDHCLSFYFVLKPCCKLRMNKEDVYFYSFFFIVIIILKNKYCKKILCFLNILKKTLTLHFQFNTTSQFSLFSLLEFIAIWPSVSVR